MRKMLQYRIYPTKKQVQKLNETLEECRWLYNHLLANHKEAYEQRGEGLSLYKQQETFGILKQERPTLKQVHSQVLQNVAVRVDLAFKTFFRRVREHAKEPGFPRFKGKGRYDSFTFPQSGFSITHDERVCLSKIGSIKMIYHRTNGTEIANPRFFRKEEKALAKVQRKHAKLAKGTPQQRKHREVDARVHERIAFRRDNFTHQTSTSQT